MYKREILLKKVITLGVIGVVYYLFIKISGFSIPCPISYFTKGKIQCPGCGVTQFALNIIKLDFISAFWANPCIFVLSVIWFITLISIFVLRTRSETNERVITILVYISIASLLIFCVIRNIYNW